MDTGQSSPQRDKEVRRQNMDQAQAQQLMEKLGISPTDPGTKEAWKKFAALCHLIQGAIQDYSHDHYATTVDPDEVEEWVEEWLVG
jgi:hypothetical protein